MLVSGWRAGASLGVIFDFATLRASPLGTRNGFFCFCRLRFFLLFKSFLFPCVVLGVHFEFQVPHPKE